MRRLIRILFVLVLFAAARPASAQKFSISTDLLGYARLGTMNVDASYAVARRWSLIAGARYNPFTFRKGDPLERYAVSYPNFGTSYWFYPQIFRYLEEKGISAWELFSVMGTDVTSRDALLRALLARYPQKASYIEQIFNRYI